MGAHKDGSDTTKLKSSTHSQKALFKKQKPVDLGDEFMSRAKLELEKRHERTWAKKREEEQKERQYLEERRKALEQRAKEKEERKATVQAKSLQGISNIVG